VKAALYEAARTIRIVDRPMPKAAPGEAVVEIELVGICGSDLHIYFEGALPPGIVLGHENVGTIVQLGEGVRGLQVGDRVAAGPPGSCGRCFHCLHGRPSLCVDGFEQTNGLRRDGGMAEYMLVKDPERMLYSIPANVSFRDAVLVDPMAVALRGILQSRFTLGDNVVVSGAGPIGLAAAQFAKIGGARHLTVLEPVAEKRRLAVQVGADLALDPIADGEGLTGRLVDLYGGVGADVVMECAGVPQSFYTCLPLVRPAGQLLMLGAGADPISIVPAALCIREIDVFSSLAYSADEARLCLGYLADGRFRTEGFLSDVISLDDVVEKGFERLVADRTLVKVAVAP
jgi:threonine dehydrogenase-like Zn-dependent dehydrogenase